jgi:hypothetical protein
VSGRVRHQHTQRPGSCAQAEEAEVRRRNGSGLSSGGEQRAWTRANNSLQPPLTSPKRSIGLGLSPDRFWLGLCAHSPPSPATRSRPT